MQKRELRLDLLGEDAVDHTITPGPGAYNDKKPVPSVDGNQCVFKSNTRKEVEPTNSDTPAPSHYAWSDECTRPNLNNAANGFVSKGERFTVDKQPTDEEVGPGSYDGPGVVSIGAKLSEQVSRGGNASFNSDAPRNLPWDV